jgi:hypothetical protein
MMQTGRKRDHGEDVVVEEKKYLGTMAAKAAIEKPALEGIFPGAAPPQPRQRS